MILKSSILSLFFLVRILTTNYYEDKTFDEFIADHDVVVSAKIIKTDTIRYIDNNARNRYMIKYNAKLNYLYRTLGQKKDMVDLDTISFYSSNCPTTCTGPGYVDLTLGKDYFLYLNFSFDKTIYPIALNSALFTSCYRQRELFSDSLHNIIINHTRSYVDYIDKKSDLRRLSLIKLTNKGITDEEIRKTGSHRLMQKVFNDMKKHYKLVKFKKIGRYVITNDTLK